ncbi:hypothetical protein F8388_000564 [Cannabis sativa]|uniref:Reverse transcriptase zinc-binding domain-containing protein n=1 Tax=Cannabis sativa TaxID=3483 RepID=A0A7J6EZW0_CANSA|nr:hypothetical protein F8388_000564 [Cannabis sativa]KAF4365744.1 hypothetical protein G4B88_020412 [Cannabis sativa]
MPQTPDLTMEDLLDRTGNLRVEDEEGWEVNEERESEAGKSCLLGRFCSNKNMNRSLIRTILGRVWGLAEVDWGVKIKRVTTEASFMIFSFKNETDLTRIILTKWEDELKRFPLTGRVLNLPTKSITRNNMLRLASMAGEGIDLAPRITNQNSLRVEVPTSNPSMPFNFVNLMDRFDVQRVEKDFEKDGESGMKRRAEFWEVMNKGDGLEHESGKRIHREGSGVQASSEVSLSNEGGEWIDIPITFENELGGENSGQKGGRKKRVVAKKNKKLDTKLKPPISTNSKEMAENLVHSVKEKGLRWRVADGSKVRINEDRWIPRGAPFLLRAPAMVPPTTYVNSLINDTARRDCGEDDLIWHYTINGDYTVASGYNVTQIEKQGAETSNKSIVRRWWKEIWQSNLTPKMKNFVWRVYHNWIPSKSVLVKRDIQIDRTCSGCWNHDETIGHALWNCPRLKNVWRNAGFWQTIGHALWNCPRLKNVWRNAWFWHLFPKGLGLMIDLVDFLIWIPWALDYITNTLQRDTENRKAMKVKQGCGIAAVIRDNGGCLVAAEAGFQTGYISVLMTEILAIKLGLNLAQRLKVRPFFC